MKYKNTLFMGNPFAKRCLTLAASLFFAFTSIVAQRSYTFNAVALNVDGLPEKISGVEVNEGAPGAEGATLMGNAIAKQNWDIVGLSEDFNYHTELTSPLAAYYHIGTWRNEIELGLFDILSKKSADTDGLGLLVAKRDGTGFSNESWTSWNTYNGYTDSGSDGLIDKGFRYYAITIANGIVIDVYVLHMDAGDSSGDISTRESQLAQLATYIKGTNNKRPILIIGDTNCRYTREHLKTGFIDVINADSRFIIKDAWVEKMWDGVYPTYGADAMMWYNAPYNNNTGEVVDKIFYINNTDSPLTIEANSYLHNTSFGVSDHYPVIANFTITDPNGEAPSEDDFTVDFEGNSGDEEPPVFMGNQVTNNTTYFIKNVSTGLYLKSGADYGTRAIEGSAGMAVTFKASGSKWKLYTSSSVGVLAQTEPYMDGVPGEWTLEAVAGTSYQYYIKCSAGTLSSTDNALKKVNCVAHNINDDKQKWVLLTEEQMKKEMLAGTAIYPYDATPLIKAADFDRMDDEFVNSYSYWVGADENTIGGIWWEGDARYNGCAAIVNSTKSSSLKQTVTNMPAGYYRISFEGFYRSIKNSSDQTLNATVTVGGLTFNLDRNTITEISTDRLVPGHVFRDNDEYAQLGTFQLTNAGDITITITNPSTTGNNWVCIDNFKLVYSKDGFGDPYEEYRRMVAEKINTTYEKVLLLNDAGRAAYDISTVIYRYNNDMINSHADAVALCAMVDEAYANAYAAHLAAEKVDNADGLKVHFTFEDAKSVVGNYTGVLYNDAALTTFGGLPVLSLGSDNGYFDMSASVGNVIAALDNFTVSTNVYIPTTTSLGGAGNFIYTFSNSADIAGDANGCIFFRAGETDSRYAISTARWETEQSISIPNSPFADGDWHTVTYRQNNGNGEIFVDGVSVASGNISINPKTLGVTEYNFLGRPCYVGDAYLQDAMYNDFRIYKGAIDDTELKGLTSNLDALNTALYKIQIADLMAKITLDATVLYDDIELPSPSENGIVVTWSSSNTSVVSTTGEVVRPDYGQPDAKVALTVTLTKGNASDRKSFDITVPAWPLDEVSSVQEDLENIVLKGHLDNLMTNLYLPTKGLQGSTITWESSEPEYLDITGQLLQQHPDKKLPVTLTATVTKGSASATRTFDICLAVKLPMQYYLFAYFNGNAQSQEQICFALSKDGYNYTPLNEGQPIINSADIAKKQAVRDPHILRGEDGYFYMVVTDMRSDEGWASNDGLVLLRSDDMVNWSHKAIDFPTAWPERFDRNSLTQVWAPQTIYDPEEGKYMVYYTIGESGKHYVIYYSYANEDFTELTEPQVLYDHGSNTIDADIVWHDGQYHMFFKTEGNGNGIQKATAKTLRGTWTPGNKYLQQTDVAVEGSGVFKLIDSDTWVLMYDCYNNGYYEYCTSTDLSTFTKVCNSNNTSIFTPRHGTTITITSEEACRLLKEWPSKTDFDNIPLELYESSQKAPRGVDGGYDKVILHRAIKAKATEEENVESKPIWNSFVVPFDIPASMLSGWEIKELTASSLEGETLTLTFSTTEDIKANGIKAGVPYMVRNESLEDNLTSITMENVTVNTTLKPTQVEHATFTGVYHYDYMPQGVFFINNNIFYEVKEEKKNKSKGYRAYIKLSDGISVNVRSLSYRTDEEDDDTPVGAVAGEVTVVGIYDTRGVRLDDLQNGINILQMSDGSTIKVIIKD